MDVGLVSDQEITNEYAIYNGDNMEVLPSLRKESVNFSIYSPPFGGMMYNYSSSPRDHSNVADYGQFFKQYEYVVRELARVTLPGRMTAVHCMDLPTGNSGCDHYIDFPGDIIRLHEKCGFKMASPRITIWKEPLTVRNRTLTKALAHKTIVVDSASCTVAGADYLLIFRNAGKNPIPIEHPNGLTEYAGERQIPQELLRYKGWTGKQTENRYSHWIWRQYASSVWDDIRGNTGSRVPGVLPYREARDEEDEKHLHPLQLDVITRSVTLWTNKGETVLTPYLGVGSEVAASIDKGRKGIGIELKPSYYRQAVKNLKHTVKNGLTPAAPDQFDWGEDAADDAD